MGLYALQGQTAIIEGITERLRSQGEHLAGSCAAKTELIVQSPLRMRGGGRHSGFSSGPKRMSL